VVGRIDGVEIGLGVWWLDNDGIEMTCESNMAARLLLLILSAVSARTYFDKSFSGPASYQTGVPNLVFSVTFP
jgi:hypothetical protein